MAKLVNGEYTPVTNDGTNCICGTGTTAVFDKYGSTQKCVSNDLLKVKNCSTYQEHIENPDIYLCKACKTNHILIL